MENLRGGKPDLNRLGIKALDNIPKGSLIVLLSPAVPSSDKWLMDSQLSSPPSLLASHNCPGLLECWTWARSVLQPRKSGTLRCLCQEEEPSPWCWGSFSVSLCQEAAVASAHPVGLFLLPSCCFHACSPCLNAPGVPAPLCLTPCQHCVVLF